MESAIKEIKTVKLDVEEKSREAIINNEIFNNVIVRNFWDAHGEEIPWEDDDGKTSHTYTNAKVLLERVTRVYHFKHSDDNEFEVYELKINGEEYTGEITSCKGSKELLIIKACIGAG